MKKSMFLWLVGLFLIVPGVLAAPCSEATSGSCYYVDTQSIGGTCSDAGPGSLTEPFCTTPAGIDAIGPGDYLYIREGTYTDLSTTLCYNDYADCGALYVDKSGTPENPITIKGYPGDAKPVLVGSTTPGSLAFAASWNGQSNLVIDGLEFTQGIFGIWMPIAHNITLTNSVIRDNVGDRGNNNQAGLAIFFNNDGEATNILVENNTFYNNHDADPGGLGNSANIWVYSCNNCFFRNNLLYDAPNGIGLKGQVDGSEWDGLTENVEISGNTIHGIYGDAIKLRLQGAFRNITVFDNTIYDSDRAIFIGSASISPSPSHNISIYHNTIDMESVGTAFATRSEDQYSTHVFNNIFYNSQEGYCTPHVEVGYGNYQQDFIKEPLEGGESSTDFQENNNIIYTPGDDAASILYCWETPKTLSQWRTYWSGSGVSMANETLNEDPLFMDALGRDYSLQETSPALDAGRIILGFHCAYADDDPVNPMDPEADCRHWHGSAPDIGAFEYQGPCTPDCTGKECGSDGCGGSCGSCSDGWTCNVTYQCQQLASADFSVGFTLSLDKVFFEAPTEFAGQITNSTLIEMAKREYEATQLVIFPEQDLTNVEVSVSDLARSGGGTISADNIEINPVSYTYQYKGPKVPGDRIGWIPDALLPNQAFDLSNGVLQPYLITVQTTPSTLAGDYSGDITISVDGQPAAVLALNVTVWDVTLPKTSRFKTTSFSLWNIRNDNYQMVANLSYKNRIPPASGIVNGFNTWSCSSYGYPTHDAGVFNEARIDERLDYHFDQGGNIFFLTWSCDITQGGEDEYRQYLSDYKDYLESKGLLSLSYVYNLDEPWGSDDLTLLQYIYGVVKDVWPKFRVMQNTNQDNDQIIGWLLGYFDALDINLGHYYIMDSPTYRANNPDALEDFWWNINIWPDVHPNMFLEYPLIDARIIGPVSYKFNISGFEYWDVISHWSIDNYYDIPSNELRVNWQVNNFSLDGTLIYPSDDGRVFSSLRFESFRDGMEDLDMLYLLEERDPDNPLLDVSVVSFTSSDPSDWFVDFEDNPENYLAWRRQLGEALSGLPDTVSPVRTEGWPSGSLPNGTTSYTISLQTGEDATCKYATTPGVSYNSMPYAFTMRTGGIIHTTTVTGLQETNTYYVRCQDLSGNANTDDYLITFTTMPTDVTVFVDSTYSSSYDKDSLIDGVTSTTLESEMWASNDAGGTHWVVLNFSSPKNLTNVTLWWGWNGFQEAFMTSQQVEVQYWDGNQYQTVATIAPGVENISRTSVVFGSVLTDSLRFWQPDGQGPLSYPGVMWLTEVEWGEGGSTPCTLPYDEPTCGCIDSVDLAESITGWFVSQISISELLGNIKSWKTCT